MKPDIAVIDIGSNSVRLMLAAAESGRVRSIAKRLNTTRLAKGIDATGFLAPDRVRDTVDAIEAFFGTAKQYDVPVIAYATSAVRDAGNRDAFTALVRERTGLVIRVLSGEEEGRLAFSAVTGGEGTVFDIGGGSFQIVTRTCAQSFPCGCVRAKERCDAGYGVGTGYAVYLDFADAIRRLGKDTIEEKYSNLFQMYQKITDENPYETLP